MRAARIRPQVRERDLLFAPLLQEKLILVVEEKQGKSSVRPLNRLPIHLEVTIELGDKPNNIVFLIDLCEGVFKLGDLSQIVLRGQLVSD